MSSTSKASLESLSALIARPLPEIAGAIAAGEVSSVELTRCYLDRIALNDQRLHAYIAVTADAAMAQAADRDRAQAEGRRLGPLHGVPIALKDLCETDFAPTSNGMAIFRDRRTGRNAAVVDNLLAAGAVVLGKLAMAEGACATHHPQMPVPVNPWGERFRVGSSSSGSGVAVAAGMAAAAIGSDTGGSIRFPSAYCGLTGLKPSKGLVSTEGICPMAPSLDHVGPMATNAAGCALMLQAMLGLDAMPATSSPRSRLGYLPGLLSGGVDGEIAAAYRRLLDAAASGGLQLVPVQLPETPDLHDIWSRICARETALSHAQTYPAHRGDYGAALAAMIEDGLRLSEAQYAADLRRQAEISREWQAVLETVDWLALPIHAAIPPLLDNALGAPNRGIGNPLLFTAAANVSGLPALALPAGRDSRGCPIGVQVMGKMHSDFDLLALGGSLQACGLAPLSLLDQ